MSSDPIINLDEILAPIPGEKPAGENLLYAGLHDQIRKARHAEDDFAQGVWKRETKTANWFQVLNLANEALTTKTKDLQVSAWLTEALIKIHGFAGLRDGLKLVTGLLERYWETLYPEVDDGDLTGRANALAFLDRWSSLGLKKVPLTQSVTGLTYSYLEWEDSKNYEFPDNFEELGYEGKERAKQLKERASAEGKVTGAQWRAAQNGSDRAFYEETFALVNESFQEFEKLDRLMDQKFERQTPGMSSLKLAFDEVRSLLEKIVKEKRILGPDPGTAAADLGAVEAQASDSGYSTGSGPIRTRQDALRRLADVSNYFRKTEPHSPVSYLLQRAIHWCDMPLEKWLEEVIKDGGVLAHLRETLGIKADVGR